MFSLIVLSLFLSLSLSLFLSLFSLTLSLTFSLRREGPGKGNALQAVRANIFKIGANKFSF